MSPAQNSPGHSYFTHSVYFYWSKRERKCNMSRHYKLQQPDKESMAESNIFNTKEPYCGCCSQGSEQQGPFGWRPGISGRGTDDSPHMQAAASSTLTLGKSRVYMSPQAQKAWGSPWCLWFPMFNIVYIIKLLPKTLHCKLYYLHCVLGKTVNTNEYFKQTPKH